MFVSSEKKKYTLPLTELITILDENGIMEVSCPQGINGGTSTTAYDEVEWN